MSSATNRSRQEIRSRIEALLNILLLPEFIDSGLSYAELATKIQISERSIRNYIKELIQFSILEYTNDGKIKINSNLKAKFSSNTGHISIDLLSKQEHNLFSPSFKDKSIEEFILSIENNIPPETDWTQKFLSLTNDEKQLASIEKFLKKIESPLLNWRTIVEKIKILDPHSLKDPSGRTILHGNKLIISQPKLILDTKKNYQLAGVTAKSKAKIWWIHGVASLFPVLLSTSGVATAFNGLKRIGKPLVINLPTQRTFEYPDLPNPTIEFPELLTSYGDLTNIPLYLASRLLATAQLYETSALLMERSDTPIDYLILNGSLFPHGFTFPAGTTTRSDTAYLSLLRDVTNPFTKMLKLARDHGTQIISFSNQIYDKKFSQLIFNQFNYPQLIINDSVFSSQILLDQERTCLFQRIESGKPDILSKNSFEFYINIRSQISAVEFLKLNESDDIFVLQDLISKIVYTISEPLISKQASSDQYELVSSPYFDKISNPIHIPFVLQESADFAERQLILIERFLDQIASDLEQSIQEKLQKLYDDLPINRDNTSTEGF